MRSVNSPAASSEERVLLECSRGRLNAQSTSTIAALIASGLDWTKLIALALHHRVAPALLAPLTQASVCSLVPGEILAALQHYGSATKERNRYLASELGTILSALADAGVSALPFKGVLLAEMLYGDLGQRPPGDLDFLVRQRDVTRACDVLVSRGYRHYGVPGVGRRPSTTCIGGISASISSSVTLMAWLPNRIGPSPSASAPWIWTTTRSSPGRG